METPVSFLAGRQESLDGPLFLCYLSFMLSPNSVVCGEALNLFTHLSEGSIDLIVTSPPYNVGIEYDVYKDSLKVEEYHFWLRQVCQQIFRVLKPNCNAFINICDIGVSNRDAADQHKIGSRGNFYVVPHHTVVIDAMMNAGAQYLHPIFWKKPSNHCAQFGANARFCGTYPYPRNCHVPSEVEYILHFRKNGIWQGVDKSTKEASRLTKERWLQLSGQVWDFNGQRDNQHPAQFPLELPLRCIDGWSFVGDLVLDPFLGAGTTAVAASLRNRKYLGFELSKPYCELAERRIQEARV